LSFYHNKIGDQGLIALSEVIGKGALPGINFIDLDNNQATKMGKNAMRDVATSHGFKIL